MSPLAPVDPLGEIVIVECRGGLNLRIYRNKLLSNSQLFATELRRFKRQVAPGIQTVRTNLPYRSLRNYALWLGGSPTFGIFDPTLTAPELFLEPSDLHIAAVKLQDEGFENDLMDAMVDHLIGLFDEMLLEQFVAEFVQINPVGSTWRKLVADWLVWSRVASDITPEALLQQIKDADFCHDVVKALLNKKELEWEAGPLPPFVVSKCSYHTHVRTSKGDCMVGAQKEAKVEKMVV